MKRKAHFQRTLAAQSSFEKYGRKSKREQFLDEMNKVVPWAGLLALVQPHYPKAGKSLASGWTGDHASGLFRAAVV